MSAHACRFDLDRCDSRRVQIELHAINNPASQEFVAPLAGPCQHAAGVRHASRRREQHQALVRRRPVVAAARQIVGQGPVVKGRIVSPQRELDAVLPLGRSVTCTGVAPHFRHRRHDVADVAHAGMIDSGYLVGNLGALRAHRRRVLQRHGGELRHEFARFRLDQAN